MISIEEAVGLIQKHMPDFGVEDVNYNQLQDAVILENIIADREYPPFNRVMMDGIAVNFNIYREGFREFKIAGVSPAGEEKKTLIDSSGCFEVMTGAPLPDGTDLVIPYEHLVLQNGYAKVVVESERSHMENVHLQGSDTKQGETLLIKGQKMNGPHWGIATSVGTQQIRVKRKPRCNVISTGDELVDVESKPLNHQIRRSNAYAIKASLQLFGFHDVDLSHLPDETAAIESHYQVASKNYDILIYSGGVSKGKFDYLPSCWKKSGVQEIFHGISQRPGKPLWFGRDHSTNTVVIGLPGNPVSSLVCLHRYFLPHSEIYAELSEEITFKKELTLFVPVKIEFSPKGVLKAHPVNIKNSGEFTALAGTDGFLELPKDQTIFRMGEIYKFHPWRPM